ncbi:hypothetical protein BLA24_28605 [Streptomyces cinnamoneus]|uniref:Uncharacterized protein n=1 Tax=Streptomyces cinnamoneus TaxID=53446 RepID=A0A2G1XBT6_STRCJ|nr:hypothetical protein [Streptomyces cinnamoneus]PHQ48671.1 hypothetical protein BLA24_28605 [Streptomyces cinnamoneus]PPT12648.1 hypothetical protein CYQ11_06860 [Streptomyces cinnamoneus]
MHINWEALGQVFGVSLVVTVGLVGVFTLGIIGTSPRKPQEQPDGTVAAVAGPAALVRTGAYACYALCAAAVGYGIYLIVA